MNKLEKYILEGWDKTLRRTDWCEGEKGSDDSLWLPYPYTVPCDGEVFIHLFYWDTYFADRGLLLSGRPEVVEGNLRNFIYMINKYGKIPNGSRERMLNRSQPAFFGMMLDSYYRATGDENLFKEGLEALKKELSFWYEKRTSENGLAHYGCDGDSETYVRGYNMYRDRTGIALEGDVEYMGKNVYAEAESGWDFNGRFGGRCLEYNAVDLNALLWFDEMLLGKHTKNTEYTARADARKEKMIALMRDEDGAFYDYSYVENKKSTVVSCASFFPQFVGMVDDDKGMEKLISSLELAFGLQATVACEGNFQWGENNGWAPLQLVAVEALLNCARREDAVRIAKKYVALVEKCFAETGHLWEKYNVLEGTSNAVGEYGTPKMLGWSAGVYKTLKNLIETKS